MSSDVKHNVVLNNDKNSHKEQHPPPPTIRHLITIKHSYENTPFRNKGQQFTVPIYSKLRL